MLAFAVLAIVLIVMGVATALVVNYRRSQRDWDDRQLLERALSRAAGVHVHLQRATLLDEHRGVALVKGDVTATVVDMDGQPQRVIRARGSHLEVPLPARLMAVAELDGLAAIDVHLTWGGIDAVQVHTKSGVTANHTFA